MNVNVCTGEQVDYRCGGSVLVCVVLNAMRRVRMRMPCVGLSGSSIGIVAFTIILCAAIGATGNAVEEDRERWPLIFAAGEGDAKTVKSLLDSGVDVHQRSKDGESALHVAAIRGSMETAQHLLRAGALVDARTPRGGTLHMTPTMWALYHGHAELVELLLRAGADPNAEDENGKSLLVMAQEARQPAIEAMLRAKIAVTSGL